MNAPSPERPLLTTNAPEIDVPTHLVPTGNLWVSLADIDATDGSFHSLGVLIEASLGLVEAGGGPGREPSLRPWLTLDGEPVVLSGLTWRRQAHWLPVFTCAAPEGVLEGRIGAHPPTGRRTGCGPAPRLPPLGKAPRPRRMGWSGRWATSVTHLRSKTLEGRFTGLDDSWDRGQDRFLRRRAAATGHCLVGRRGRGGGCRRGCTGVARPPRPGGHRRRIGLGPPVCGRGHRARRSVHHRSPPPPSRLRGAVGVQRGLAGPAGPAGGGSPCPGQLDGGAGRTDQRQPVLQLLLRPGGLSRHRPECHRDLTEPALLRGGGLLEPGRLLLDLPGSAPLRPGPGPACAGVLPGCRRITGGRPCPLPQRHTALPGLRTRSGRRAGAGRMAVRPTTGDTGVLGEPAVRAAVDGLGSTVDPWRHEDYELYGTFLLPTDDPTAYPYVTRPTPSWPRRSRPGPHSSSGVAGPARRRRTRWIGRNGPRRTGPAPSPSAPSWSRG